MKEQLGTPRRLGKRLTKRYVIELRSPPVPPPQAFTCVAIGLWAGLLIGLFTEYYTSNRFTPVQEVADSCRTGAATNIIYGEGARARRRERRFGRVVCLE